MPAEQLIEQGFALPPGFWNISIADVLIALGTIAAIVISIAAYRHESKKANKADIIHVRDELEKALKMINNETQTKARERLYQLYHTYRQDRDLSIYRKGDAPETVNTVRATFDEMGMIFSYDSTVRLQIISTLWAPIIECWICMEDYIQNARMKGNSPLFASSFEALYREALEFRKQAHPNDPLRTD